MATFSQLIQRCVTRLAMSGGTGVQVYAEDILAEMVQARFDEMFESMWWEDYMSTQIGTLGLGGEVSIDVKTDWSLRKFTDIKHIFFDEDTYPLKLLPGRVNPRTYMEQDRIPQYISPNSGDRVFRVMPYGSIGDEVVVTFRQRPLPFLPADEVLMDDQALIYGTCFDYLSDDGSNPGATEKMRNFYNERLIQLNSSRNEQDIALVIDNEGIYDWIEH